MGVVRVVGQDLKECYGAEAVVLEVDEAARSCRIKARIGGSSKVFQGVQIENLETRVSRTCTSVRVVRGTHRGAVADLLHRDTQRSMAKIRLKGIEIEMPLD